MEEENKERTSMTLKPINKRWLNQKAFDESTAENKVSASEIVDRLIDAAREAEESQSPTNHKQKKSVRPLEVAVAA